MAEDEQDGTPDGGLDQRVASLEAGQTSLEDKVDKILGIVSGHGGDAGDGGGHGDEPSGGTNIAHEIRQQLDERDAKNRAEADEQARTDRLGAVETRLAELAEKPPEPMPRRIEKIMGWR